jgi:hypothetical protein
VNRFSVFLFLVVYGVAQLSNAGKCSVADDYSEFSRSTDVVVSANWNIISIVASSIGPLSGDDSGGWGGPHCYSTQLTYEQLNNLQDERLKAAIIRSLNSNSSWQQR